jgi:PKD repeat protein
MDKTKLLERSVITVISVAIPIVMTQYVPAVIERLNGTPIPSADFSCTAFEGTAPLPITCTAECDNASVIRWDFGDGTTFGEGEVAEHTFEKEGEYSVVLTAISGEKEARHERQISVSPGDVWKPFELTLTGLTRGDRVREQQSITIDERKSDHPKPFHSDTGTYEERFDAIVDFRIVEASFNPEEANHAGPVTWEIVDEGLAIVLRFELTSGPRWDRWDGWLRGVLLISQERDLDPEEIVLANRLTISRESHLSLVSDASLDRFETLFAKNEAGDVIGSARPGEVLRVQSKKVALQLVEKPTGLFVDVKKLT